jgi:PAS domain S-box-containing protein
LTSPTNPETTFRFLVERSPDGHFLIVDGVFRYMNPTGLAMFGQPVSAVGSLTVSDVLHPSEVERARNNMRLRQSGVLRGASTFLARRQDGTTFPIEVHAAPVEVEGTRGLHGVIRDITNRRKMEERLERMERAGLVSRLAAGIAHDFNNLLAVILANTEVASRDVRDAGIQAAITRIRVAVQRGSEKVRQIQQMGGAGQPEEEFRALYLNPIVEETLEFTEPRWRDEAEQEGLSYDIDWAGGLPPPISGSPLDLRAALMALVFNAVEAMPVGGRIQIRTGRTPAGEAFVSVHDEGHGIPEPELAGLTDPFFTTREDRQMGLGLHLVQQVLERHGGRLEVDSELGAGSTFGLVLPASETAPTEPPPPPRTELLGRPAPTEGPRAPRPRTRGGRSVLLIDDQADLVQVVETILASRGWSVDTALNGRDGIALAEATRYSVVLTDLGMPDISGWEVAQRLSELQPKTPVVLMTGWAADIDESQLAEHKIQGLLPKPFRTDSLLALIDKVSGIS